MPDRSFNTGFSSASAIGTMRADIPAAPTPPAVSHGGLPVGAPTLSLSLATVVIIVAGNINISTTFPNSVIQRR